MDDHWEALGSIHSFRFYIRGAHYMASDSLVACRYFYSGRLLTSGEKAFHIMRKVVDRK